MIDEYLSYVRRCTEGERIKLDFPNEHLSVADRLIYNLIIREQAKLFYEHTKKHTINAVLLLAINQEMEKYGFKPRRISLEW